MTDPSRVDEMTVAEQEYFEMACLNWPHNTTLDIQGDFGGCCWKWGD